MTRAEALEEVCSAASAWANAANVERTKRIRQAVTLLKKQGAGSEERRAKK